ncbi:MAG TPA: IS1634 family transposase [Candidatus Babeliales bacterium]|nr:IS1634 family transposase [Candidatus Babeliales bacterium]
MATIIKKIKNRRPYYYAVQSGRVNGKPRIIWQKYLGTIDDIIKRASESPSNKVKAVDIFEAGGVAAMLRIIQRIRLIEIIDEIIPKRNQGASMGQYLAIAIINRILAPCSKLKMPDWYRGTILMKLWKYPADTFNSQRFWDHMDFITEDHIQEIQTKIALEVKREFSINPELLLYDTSNFFTYIATGNKRNTIAQRGRSKKKRNDLRQVGLALLVTKDFQIPLFHQVYQGNTPDRGLFPKIAREIQEHHDKILGGTSDSTIVFDKGNIGQDAMERLIVHGPDFVCAIPKNTAMDAPVFATSLEQMKQVPGFPGTRAYSCFVDLWGKKLKAVLAYSESFFASQLTELTEHLQKCEKKLHDFDLAIAKKIKSKKSRSLQTLQRAAQAIVNQEKVKDFIEIVIKKQEGVFRLTYKINQNKLNEAMKSDLGRTLIISSRVKWSEKEIISAYRGQNSIEEIFKRMNNKDYLHWQPAFHWTDQKVQVHGLYCVLAQLVVALCHKVVSEKEIDISALEMLSELSDIREVALFDTEQVDKRRKGCFAISRMSPIQKRLAEATEISLVLGQ